MKTKSIIIGIIVLLVDQISKIIMINKKITLIPGFLSLNYIENTGGAFGMGKINIVLILSLVLIIGIIVFLIKQKNKINNYTPYIVIIAGSVGNLIDRIFRGYVIDFIDINVFNFPTFNIADIFITFGIIYLIINILFKCKKL